MELSLSKAPWEREARTPASASGYACGFAEEDEPGCGCDRSEPSDAVRTDAGCARGCPMWGLAGRLSDEETYRGIAWGGGGNVAPKRIWT